MSSFDYIIVGAGSAGCVLANRLTADPRRRVLLLEAGGSHRHPWTTIPGAMIYALSTPRFDWGYRAEPDPTRRNRAEHWPRGRVLGGSSSINGMIFVRGQREDFDRWERAGATGWSYTEVLPFFKRLEATDIGEDEYRGRAGPMRISKTWDFPELTRAFLDACREIGVPYNPDINGSCQAGAGEVQANLRDGRRASAAHSYLDPIRRRPNLCVMIGARVTGLEFEGSRAVGVTYQRDGVSQQARCTREIVLAAGAINSPHLLMLSGIGPAEHLRSLGVNVRCPLPGVGMNLMEHSAVLLDRHVNLTTMNTHARPLRRVLNGARWLISHSGPASSAAAHAVAFMRSDAAQPSPDLQLTLAPHKYVFRNGVVQLSERNGVSIIVTLGRPHSRGSVFLRSPSPLEAPLIQPRILEAAADVDALAAGAQRANDLYSTRAFSSYLSADDAPHPPQSEAQWCDWVRASAAVNYHPAGTCRMGADPLSVVDARLRVKGVSGLRVVDASVFPEPITGNINAATLMVGEKASDLIAADAELP